MTTYLPHLPQDRVSSPSATQTSFVSPQRRNVTSSVETSSLTSVRSSPPPTNSLTDVLPTHQTVEVLLESVNEIPITRQTGPLPRSRGIFLTVGVLPPCPVIEETGRDGYGIFHLPPCR